MTEVFLRREKFSLVKVVFSVLILSTIAIQLQSAILVNVCHLLKTPLCALPAEPELYPFLDYPMYASARTVEEAKVTQHKVIAVFADGSEKELKGEDFGLSPYWFLGSAIPAFVDQDLDKIADYIDAYEAQGNQPFVEFHVDVSTMSVTAEGIHSDDLLVGERVSLIGGVQ